MRQINALGPPVSTLSFTLQYHKASENIYKITLYLVFEFYPGQAFF